ncbi:MAG: sulfatase-like hydrolase/transferase [Planctomycetota bacterium]|nr:sulfatase-like hydrolase/transferase [Planctomycetota bacterium]
MAIRIFAILSFLIIAPCAAQEAATPRPNIVLIMADDLGYECLSCNGSKMYETPNLDKLAASGMRFKHAHSQPICTPSRVQIMTGIYNNRNYVRFGYLDPEVTTFGNLLRDAGYATCIAGKWQLKGGYAGVKKFGFDRHCLWQLNRRPSRYPNPGLEIDGEQKDFKNGEFGPDVVTDYICKYLEERKGKQQPFLVYYPMILPHWPFVPTPGSKDWDPKMWRDKKNEPGGYRTQKYWDGMVRHTDKMVGKVVDKLEELGMRENTLVIFTGDNGTFARVTSKFEGRDYKGGKGTTKDAGTHVPFFASWPKVIKGGQVRSDMVDFSDVLPTLTDAAGCGVPKSLKIDGTSLAPLFTDQERVKPYVYCWYQRNGVRQKAQQLVRTQRYKLYASGKLFDIQKDPLEASPLEASAMKEVHEELGAALARHVKDTLTADPIQQAKRKKGK